MTHYVFMFEFEAPNDLVAEQVSGELHESILDIEEGDIEGVRYGTQVLIPNRQITEEERDIERNHEIEMNDFHYRGVNHNPLPDDFPKI